MRFQLYREQQINSDIDTTWSFFSSPMNLSKITPKNMGFKVIRKSDHSPNAWILASVQSDIVIWERLTEKGNWMTSLELKKLQRVTRAIGLS